MRAYEQGALHSTVTFSHKQQQSFIINHSNTVIMKKKTTCILERQWLIATSCVCCDFTSASNIFDLAITIKCEAKAVSCKTTYIIWDYLDFVFIFDNSFILFLLLFIATPRSILQRLSTQNRNYIIYRFSKCAVYLKVVCKDLRVTRKRLAK